MYQEVSPAEFAAGEQILQAAIVEDLYDLPGLSLDILFQIQSAHRHWRSWHIERRGDAVYIDGEELPAWYEARQREPGGWAEVRERGYRLLSIRMVPECLIAVERRWLLQRVASGEVIRAATGEQSTYRCVWIVKGEGHDAKYEPVWEGSEADWMKHLCDPSVWPHCKNICHKRSYLDSI